MQRSRFSEEQIIGILKEQEVGMATADVCRKHSVSFPNLYKWKARYGGLEASDARRLRVLEDENAKLKKLLAESMLDNATMQDVAAKNVSARREAVAHFVDVHGVSHRRSCKALAMDRSSVRYRSMRADDVSAWAAMEGGAERGCNFGYRRIQVMLERQSIVMNLKKLRRL